VTAAASVTPSPRTGWRAVASLFIGSGALVAASILPVWISTLVAPQYPKGLWLWVYGGRVDGDLREINALNHYIGMQRIDPANVPELVLWAPMIIGLVLALAVAVYWRGWIGRLALLGIWATPLGVLLDIQRWLAYFGQNLDPRAALRLDPFIPLALGPTQVWNFEIWAFPGPALVLILGVALLATFGRRMALPSRTAQLASTVVALGAVAALVVFVSLPALRPTEAGAKSEASAVLASSFDLEAAVAEAEPGSTLRVPAGTYTVHLVIDRPLLLEAIGEVVLDGGGRGTVVTIAAPDVTVRGFSIRGSGGQVEESAGVKVLADRATIEANTFSQVYAAVSVQDAAGVDIVDNVVVGTGQVTAGADHATAGGTAEPGSATGAQGDAFSIWNSQGILVRGNSVREVRDAIYLSYVDEVLIDTNLLERSRYAVHSMFGSSITVFGNTIARNASGLVLMYSDTVIVGRNRISDGTSSEIGHGILLKDVRAPLIRENVIARNRIGLQADGTGQAAGAEAVVYANRFVANRVGVALMASADLAFGANSFDGNLTQVLALEAGVARRNVWAYQGTGNTWSDYAGYDTDGDGIGDLPHLSGGAEAALLTRSPALELLASAPAFHLLGASQAWWSMNFEPAVVDLHPLTVDVAPPADPPRAADQPAIWGAAGAALVLGPLAVAFRLRRPSRQRG